MKDMDKLPFDRNPNHYMVVYSRLIGIIWDNGTDIGIVDLAKRQVLMTAYAKNGIQNTFNIPTIVLTDDDFKILIGELADPVWENVITLLLHTDFKLNARINPVPAE